MKKKSRPLSFREQMALSMADLRSLIDRNESPDGNGRLTVWTISVTEPPSFNSREIKRLRRAMGLSQALFAQILGVSHVLVRSWERGSRTPSMLARRLLEQVEQNPKAFLSLIQMETKKPASKSRPPRAAA